MAKKKIAPKDNLQEIESALTTTERFIEDNQKIISYVVGGIILIVIAILGFKKFYLQPKDEEAKSQMFMAELYFEKDSFNLAVNGDGNYLGFLDIIDNYGITKASNLAKYYAGISFLNLGNYEEALDYLNDFKTEDFMLKPIKEGAKGDIYLELGDYDKAIAQYKKAYAIQDNKFTSPLYMLKAGNLLESIDELEQALEIYENIEKNYPESTEASSIDKYIARVETKLGE